MKNILFVLSFCAFAAGAQGPIGSQHYVESLTGLRVSISATNEILVTRTTRTTRYGEAPENQATQPLTQPLTAFMENLQENLTREGFTPEMVDFLAHPSIPWSEKWTFAQAAAQSGFVARAASRHLDWVQFIRRHSIQLPTTSTPDGPERGMSLRQQPPAGGRIGRQWPALPSHISVDEFVVLVFFHVLKSPNPAETFRLIWGSPAAAVPMWVRQQREAGSLPQVLLSRDAQVGGPGLLEGEELLAHPGWGQIARHVGVERPQAGSCAPIFARAPIVQEVLN